MASHTFIALAVALVCANALPQTAPPTKNTIFGDERLKGEVFENVDNFENVALFNDADNPYRLPTTTKPEHYNILWTIDIERLSYSGTVEIILVATEANVGEIVIHSDHTTILSVALSQNGVIIPTVYNLDTPYQFLRVRPNVNLDYNENNPVEYSLTISFAAEMRTDMYGIYASWFRNNYTDEVSWMASTQFQATAARYAFPCYDEPSFKATFDVTISRPIGYRSWCLTKINETAPGDTLNYQNDIYGRTPIMSTYLLAIIVAQYESIEDAPGDQMTYEVIARPSAIDAGQGQYAYDVGRDLLAMMSDHTALDFYSVNPNLKMTQAAIPDFGAGAMENWGLLTYREAYLMYDEEETSSYYKQLIAYILSHEIAHMWFGNLVTNDWWDVLWLNEGFARYYQYFLTDWVETDMGFETRFVIEQVHVSLLSDSANNPQPLTNPGVGSPAQVSNMFSTISYNKGAAVIRMTEHLLGFDVHRQGLRNYLVNKSFDTVLPIDLFEELQIAGVAAGALTEYGPEFSIPEYYRTWTEQPGHPVLNVQVNHQTGDMTITQRRFNINTGYSAINSNWVVPISFATASNPDFENTKPTHVISDTVTVINKGSTGDEWVIFNKQQTGFYRVNYDDYTWDLITLALRGADRTIIDEKNKAQIVNDVFQFARSGLMSYTRAFTILSFLEFETEYGPWVAAVTGFSWIRNRLAGTSQLAQLESMIASWAANVMTEIGYYPSDGESFMTSYLRYQLAPVMCSINVQTCRTAATAQLRALIDNGTPVPADSRNWVYCNGLRDGTQADFNFLWTRFQQHDVYTEKILLLSVLGCTAFPPSLNTFLDAIVQENFVIRPQDYTTAFNSAATGNEANTQIVFEYIQNNLQTVINAFGSASTPLSYVSSRLRSEAEVIAFQNWAAQNQVILGSEYEAVYNAAEASRESIQWAGTISNDLGNYLDNGNDVVTTTSTTTPAPVASTTVSQPNLVEPVVPELTDGAATIFSSLSLLFTAIAVNVLNN